MQQFNFKRFWPLTLAASSQLLHEKLEPLMIKTSYASRLLKSATAIGILASVASSSHAQYVARVLAQGEYLSTIAEDSTSGSQVGSGNVNGVSHAILWQDHAANPIDLHPSSYLQSEAWGVSGDSQVGRGLDAAMAWHPLLWQGTPESVVDLMPAGFSTAHAAGVGGGVQVGQGRASDQTYHALMWRGTAASVIDLHPAGYAESNAWGTDGESQVGSGNSRAMLWKGSAESAVVLGTDNYTFSAATSVHGDIQVGFGDKPGAQRDAILWRGTAESAVALNPVGILYATATDAHGDTQVGGYRVALPELTHAALWRGSAETMLDLHQYLPDLPTAVTFSHAVSIAENGDIFGYAFNYEDLLEGNPGPTYKIVWHPVPEPATATAMIIGAGALCLCNRRGR